VLEIHHPYPGVALVVTDRGSVLLGVPADAFKATKFYCNKHKLPFPRILVAPQILLIDAAPQFNPEFFLYDFLFVYGAAFKPELAQERLLLVADKAQLHSVKEALRITLNGPSRSELAGYCDSQGRRILDDTTVDQLSRVSEFMAIKKGEKPRTLEDSLRTLFFENGEVRLFDGLLQIARDGPQAFNLTQQGRRAHVDINVTSPVVPFATLPTPKMVQTPLEFGIKALGTRSGFDLSGPTTGFVFWLNGLAVIYDGPVGTKYLLESQGISVDDVDSVILSHCHEDHMGAFIEMILAGRRPKVFTAEPIYRSALTKLACYFQQPEADVASYVDYQRVTPGEPVEINGAQFEFFYTVHSIPTLGLSVTKNDRLGRKHSIQISGDTLHHEGLDKMYKAGVLNKETFTRMRHLVPKKKQKQALYFADVGEAIIHGHPKDWHKNPNDVVYYHCADNQQTRRYGHAVAAPGQLFPTITAQKIHPSVPPRLLKALSFLDVEDQGLFTSLLFAGRVETAQKNAVLQTKGAKNRSFTIVVSGLAKVVQNKLTLATLRPGEFFGAVLPDDIKADAKIVAETPMELFILDAKLFHSHLDRLGLTSTLRAIADNRPKLETSKIFGQLDLILRSQISKDASYERCRAGTLLMAEGDLSDAFYLLVSGEVDVFRSGYKIATIGNLDEHNFFGEIAAIDPKKPRTATVKAKTQIELLKINGSTLRDLHRNNMAVRYAINDAIRVRTARS
jgi:CRP-like cAMP-binding protein